MVKNKYDKPVFRYSYSDVKWENIEGEVTASIPLKVYGNAWSADFKPKYYSKKDLRLNVRRRGIMNGLNAGQYRDKKYKTYYLKPIE